MANSEKTITHIAKKRPKAPSTKSPYSETQRIEIYAQGLSAGKNFKQLWEDTHPGYLGKPFCASVNGKGYYTSHREEIDARISELKPKIIQAVANTGLDASKEAIIARMCAIFHGVTGAKDADVIKAGEVLCRIQGFDAPTKVETTHNIPTLTEVLHQLDERHARNALPVAVDIVDAVEIKSDLPATLPV